MGLESNIMVKVLLLLIEEDITALPIHDAVLVPVSHQDRAKEVMREVHKEVSGIDPVITLRTLKAS